MSPIYHRPDLAHEMATQLLSPGVLDQGLRSGFVRRKKVELVNKRKWNCRPPQPSGLPNCH